MTKKRRNGGHRVRNRGKVYRINCDICGCLVAKDKAKKINYIRNIVSTSIIKDIEDASVIENYQIPKIYNNINYCISCAVHGKIVK
tara:strand:- start:157 stop:414 length:258 start_codon:yes stop_codon:yes gene_type:complete